MNIEDSKGKTIDVLYMPLESLILSTMR